MRCGLQQQVPSSVARGGTVSRWGVHGRMESVGQKGSERSRPHDARGCRSTLAAVLLAHCVAAGSFGVRGTERVLSG